jgi:hypothetical protein
MNYLRKIVHRYSPTFAALASLREIFRISVAANDFETSQSDTFAAPGFHLASGNRGLRVKLLLGFSRASLRELRALPSSSGRRQSR